MTDTTASLSFDEPDGRIYPPPGRRLMIALSVMLATIMQTLDTTIANVALPSIQGAMSATQDQVAWVLTSYIVAAAIMTLPTGFLAARFGRKRLFMIAVCTFIVASMLCGAAQSIEQMVMFRLLQGMSGAALIPLSQAVLLDINPRDQHGRAMALWGMGVMIGPIIGPTLGGWLTETFNWRYVFYINLPVGLLALAGIMTFLPSGDREHNKPFAWRGFAFLSLGIGAMQLMMDRGESVGWFSSNEIVIEAMLGGLGLYLFVIHMLSDRNTFVSTDLLRDRNYTIGLITLFVISLNMMATLALLPPFLQKLGGYTVIDTGIVMAPRGFGTMIGMMIVGRLVGRFDERIFITLGLGIGMISLLMMAGFTPDAPQSTIMTSGFLQGLGFGLVFVPLNVLSFSTLSLDLRVEGAAIYSLMRNIGSSIGISIIIRELATTTQSAHAILSEAITPYNRPLLSLGQSMGLDPYDPRLLAFFDPQDPRLIAILNGMVTREAATLAYIHDFWFMIAVTAAALPFVLILRPAKIDP